MAIGSCGFLDFDDNECGHDMLCIGVQSAALWYYTNDDGILQMMVIPVQVMVLINIPTRSRP